MKSLSSSSFSKTLLLIQRKPTFNATNCYVLNVEYFFLIMPTRKLTFYFPLFIDIIFLIILLIPSRTFMHYKIKISQKLSRIDPSWIFICNYFIKKAELFQGRTFPKSNF